GGLSEPPAALAVTVFFLAICFVWWRGEGQSRRSRLILLLWFLAGSLTALLLMGFAPANSIRLKTAPPGLIELVFKTLSYPLAFIVGTFRALPTPTLVCAAGPALFFYVKFANPARTVSKEARRRLGIVAIVVLLLAYLLIAATFAPSVYGQSFPIPRARFAGRLLMTGALTVAGALLGILAANAGMEFFRSTLLRRFAGAALVLLMLYPLRSAWRISMEVPVYQQRAAAWDMRDSEMRALKAQGVQDLVVRFLPQEQIQDLGDHKGFRLNRCASTIYGVNSIVAVPMEEE
ncbi:MAG TPA: DUF6056 family protein, partial [Anaerolineales bacterium]|nr:DUF6056 family protein [Anaerolineales bacterium]